MLSKAQEKQIRQLHTKKGRRKKGLCLVEGEKNITAAGNAIEWTFTPEETEHFDTLVTTETPQSRAGIARIPEWTWEKVGSSKTIVVLDGVQDPGNVGTILRSCQGFGATAILVHSADPTSPKVLRSAAGAVFLTPWIECAPEDAIEQITSLEHTVFRLERSETAETLHTMTAVDNAVLVAGSEGHGITLPIEGASIHIEHEETLESLNVSIALAIALHSRYSQ